MSRIERGKKISLTFRDDGTGNPTLTVDVVGDDDVLPHEHRDEIGTVLDTVLKQPVAELEAEVEAEVKRAPPHSHPHPHPAKPIEEPVIPEPIAVKS